MRDDFIFDGVYASDFGLVISSFDSSLTSKSDVSKVKFTTFSPTTEDRDFFVDSEYSSPLSRTIQVIKMNGCEVKEFSIEEIEEIQYWLCRDDGYHPFKFVNNDDDATLEFEYNAKIDLSTIELGGKYVGLELSIATDSPYAYTTEIRSHSFTGTDDEYVIVDNSSKIGTTPINMVITCMEPGDLEIANLFNGTTETVEVKNCKVGEIITLTENQIVSSTFTAHKIMNDFNFLFPSISNTISDGKYVKKNIFTTNLACEIKFTYKIRRKVGI